MNKIKDVAGLLKAKITKDDLQEALINATSQQNWQASTHILHEIANAAYNYQKCQQINEFIWDKLKKGKTWRKILKSLSLVQFLLKNGPPSIITTYKYDIYQFRSFDNFSHYDQGLDRGQSIRQKAKVVVDLLTNQQLLEEERLKAKTIRERMSGVVGGSNYGGLGAKEYNSGTKYGSLDNKAYSTGGYGGNQTYQTNGGLGTYGDYSYNKSTLDKYKDNKATGIQSPLNKPGSTNPIISHYNKEEVKQPVVDNKKPFERIAPKLVKPGSKPVAPKQQSTVTATKKQTTNNVDIMDDILGGDEPITVQTQATIQPVVQPQVQQTQVHPAQQTNNNSFNLGFSFQPQPQPITPQNGQQIFIQPQQTQQVQPQQVPQYIQPQNQNLNFVNQPQIHQPQMYQPQSHQPQISPQMHSQNLYQQYPNQTQLMGGYPNLYQPQMQVPQYPNYNQQSYQNQQQQFTLQPQVHQPQQPQQQWNNQKQQLGGLNNISLATTKINKKQDDQFGNFSSAQNTNVKWLSTEEKGLIDFSDFGEELKKDTKAKDNHTINNNIDTTWNW